MGRDSLITTMENTGMTKETKAALLRDYKAPKDPLNHIHIAWKWKVKHDQYGTVPAYGAIITLNGETIMNYDPEPETWKDWTPEEIIHDLLMKLGYSVISDTATYEEDCYEDA